MTDVAAPAAPNPLKDPNFRRLWLNNIGYFIVWNAQRFVFGWFVLDGLDLDETSQGLVVFALGVPALFLVIHAGVWADRLDRRLLLIATQLATCLIMLGAGFLVSSGRATFTWVILAALLAGASGILGQPVRASLVPALVPREQLFSAIALNALAMTVSMILGPVLVKAAGDQFGFEGAYWFLALLMAVGLLFLIRLQVPPLPASAETPSGSVISETVAALRHVIGDRSLRTLFGLLLVASFTVNPAVMVTLQAFVKEELHRESGDAALLFAIMGVGIAISSAVVMRKGDMANKGTLFQRAMMVGSTATALMGRTTDFNQLLPLVFVMGLAGGFYINMNQGLIQASTPQEMMGRVMGLYTLIQSGFLPIGALFLGFVASKIGVGNAITGAGLVSLCAVTVTYVKNAELRRLG